MLSFYAIYDSVHLLLQSDLIIHFWSKEIGFCFQPKKEFFMYERQNFNVQFISQHLFHHKMLIQALILEMCYLDFIYQFISQFLKL